MGDGNKGEGEAPIQPNSTKKYKPTNVRLTEPPSSGLPPATPIPRMSDAIIDTSKLHPTSIKNIIVTGVTGQDGSHMVDYLLKNTPHKIYGGIRRLSVPNHINIEHLLNEPRFELVSLDLTDDYSIRDCIIDIQPDYFINFAAQSFVAGSWEYPIQTWITDSTSVLHMLESIRRFVPSCRFYNAGSSEEFGDVMHPTQDEKHPLRPQSPYGAAKSAARQLVRVYRESYDLYAVQGWLFNHEGTRRGLQFVTRKISHGVAKIKLALENKEPIPVLKLGNLQAKRDWSDTEDFMAGVWMMMNQDNPRNYVLASGEMHSVREFLDMTLKCAGIDFRTEGKDEHEKYYTKNDELIFEVNIDYYRPAEVHKLCGDPSLVEKELGWKRTTNFPKLVKKMYKHDYKLLKDD